MGSQSAGAEWCNLMLSVRWRFMMYTCNFIHKYIIHTDQKFITEIFHIWQKKKKKEEEEESRANYMHGTGWESPLQNDAIFGMKLKVKIEGASSCLQFSLLILGKNPACHFYSKWRSGTIIMWCYCIIIIDATFNTYSTSLNSPNHANMHSVLALC